MYVMDFMNVECGYWFVQHVIYAKNKAFALFSISRHYHLWCVRIIRVGKYNGNRNNEFYSLSDLDCKRRPILCCPFTNRPLRKLRAIPNSVKEGKKTRYFWFQWKVREHYGKNGCPSIILNVPIGFQDLNECLH